MIEIKNLNGRLGDFKLHDINLSVEQGEYLVILGPTGAGKSVLIEYIVGIYTPESGNILINNKDILPVSIEDRNIAYVPQDYALFPNLSVEKNLAYGLEARNMPKADIQRIVDETITSLKIESIRKRMPLHLSGGEKQRVALGRALATKPSLVLMDEPLSALDENLRSNMARELLNLQRKTNSTFIHVSHNFEEASDVADRITIMDKGRIVQTGTLHELMNHPETEFTANFLKTQNIFKAVTDGNTIKIGKATLIKKNRFNGEVTAAIRPENILISSGSSLDDQDNVLSATIESVKLKPYYTEIVLNSLLPIILYGQNENNYKPGQSVKIQLPQDKIILI
jgi:ABC-type Fe3+/spermidine/putrescine transport system ATPase subunit